MKPRSFVSRRFEKLRCAAVRILSADEVATRWAGTRQDGSCSEEQARRRAATPAGSFELRSRVDSTRDGKSVRRASAKEGRCCTQAPLCRRKQWEEGHKDAERILGGRSRTKGPLQRNSPPQVLDVKILSEIIEKLTKLTLDAFTQKCTCRCIKYPPQKCTKTSHCRSW